MEELVSKDIPESPSYALIDWVCKKHLGNVHALAYRSGWLRDPLSGIKERCVDVQCSVCGEGAKLVMVGGPGCGRGAYSSPAPYGFMDIKNTPTTHGQCTLCPCCGTEVKAVYASRITDAYMLGECTVLDVQNVKGHLCLIYWRVWREINDAVTEAVKASLRYAFVVETKRINVFERNGNGAFRRHQYKDIAGKVGVVYPWKKCILEGTTAENSKLDLYMKVKGEKFPVSYLRLWIQRKSVENLLVQGVGNILGDMIRRDCKSSYWYYNEVNIPHLKDVNWKDKRPAQMLGINKEDLRWAAKQNWTLSELELFRNIKARETVKPETDIPLIRQLGEASLKYLLTHQASGSVMRSVRYLLKQKKQDAVTLIDYWRLVQQNGGDPEDPIVRYPQDLHRAHDAESEKQRFNRQKGYPEKFAARTQVLMPWAWEYGGLTIRPVQSAEELYQEGKQLHHCVYSYLDRHVKGETAIFLIRKLSEPDIPFYTLEFDELSLCVRQNRGRNNCGKTKEVQAFEDKWLAWVKENMGKDRKTA